MLASIPARMSTVVVWQMHFACRCTCNSTFIFFFPSSKDDEAKKNRWGQSCLCKLHTHDSYQSPNQYAYACHRSSQIRRLPFAWRIVERRQWKRALVKNLPLPPFLPSRQQWAVSNCAQSPPNTLLLPSRACYSVRLSYAGRVAPVHEHTTPIQVVLDQCYHFHCVKCFREDAYFLLLSPSKQQFRGEVHVSMSEAYM